MKPPARPVVWGLNTVYRQARGFVSARCPHTEAPFLLSRTPALCPVCFRENSRDKRIQHETIGKFFFFFFFRQTKSSFSTTDEFYLLL